MQSMPEPVWEPPEDMGDQLYLFWASNIIFVDIFYCILESPRPSIPCSPRSFLTWPNSNTTWKPAHILAFVPPTHCILSYWKGFFGALTKEAHPEGVRRCKRQDRGRVPKNGKRTCDFVVVVAASDSAPLLAGPQREWLPSAHWQVRPSGPWQTGWNWNLLLGWREKPVWLSGVFLLDTDCIMGDGLLTQVQKFCLIFLFSVKCLGSLLYPRWKKGGKWISVILERE